MSEKYNLTPVELELMEILWKISQGTVRDVMAQLPKKRELAYTSVSTILRILQQKKILTAKKTDSRQHVYIPLLSKQKYAAHSVNKIMYQVFSGNSVEMVAHLMKQNHLTRDDIDSIQQLLEDRKKEMVS
jgi:BlaI family transcriptional regulator, penicillinase repressor